MSDGNYRFTLFDETSESTRPVEIDTGYTRLKVYRFRGYVITISTRGGTTCIWQQSHLLVQGKARGVERDLRRCMYYVRRQLRGIMEQSRGRE